MISLVFKEFVEVLQADMHRNGQRDIAKSSLFLNISFQLPESAKNDPLIGFRVFRNALSAVSTIEQVCPRFSIGARVLLTGSSASVEDRFKYSVALERTPQTIVVKEHLAGYKRLLSKRFLALWAFLSLFCGTIAFFSKNGRITWALVPRMLLELEVLCTLLEDLSPVYFEDFDQYDKDSNLYYLSLKRKFPNLIIRKYPSPGPLFLHNSQVLSDIIAINHPYHIYELNHFKASMIYSSFEMVPPELFHKYLYRYIAAEEGAIFNIGYYSHGGWIRKMHGHVDDGLGIAETEFHLTSKLSEFLKLNSNVSLKVYTHPKERSTYFTDIFRRNYSHLLIFGDRVQFVDREESSVDLFSEVDVGIGVYSTILFERLFCGFKTLFLSPDLRFPLKGSTLDSVTFSSTSLLIEKLGASLQISSDDFFKLNKLTEFRYNSNNFVPYRISC